MPQGASDRNRSEPSKHNRLSLLSQDLCELAFAGLQPSPLRSDASENSLLARGASEAPAGSCSTGRSDHCRSRLDSGNRPNRLKSRLAHRSATHPQRSTSLWLSAIWAYADCFWRRTCFRNENLCTRRDLSRFEPLPMSNPCDMRADGSSRFLLSHTPAKKRNRSRPVTRRRNSPCSKKR